MAEALLYRDSLTSTALTRASASAVVAGEVQCQTDGRAGVLNKTADYAEGSALANRVEVWFDGRTPADPQVYVDGVNVLPASVFSMAAASGPLYLLAHLEKTSSTDTYKVAVDWLRVRVSDD